MSSLFHQLPVFGSPETCLALCRRIQAELLAIAPELTQREVCHILGELALCDGCIHRIAERVRNSPEYETRMRLPAPIPELPKGTPALPNGLHRNPPSFADRGGPRWRWNHRART
jgi:hypothetical protein